MQAGVIAALHGKDSSNAPPTAPRRNGDVLVPGSSIESTVRIYGEDVQPAWIARNGSYGKSN